MKSKFLKPTLGVVCAMTFFMLSFTSVSANQTVSENQITISNSNEFDTYAVSDWWVLASSNWVLTGPGK